MSQAQSNPAAAQAVAQGEKLFARGDAGGAEACFRLALERDPNCASALNNMGVLRHGGRDFKNAWSFFSRAWAQEPDNFDFTSNLVALLLQTGSPGAAGRVLDGFVAHGGDEKPFRNVRKAADQWASPVRCATLGLPVVRIEDIHERLGFDATLRYEPEALNKPLQYWRMELDDSPIFRYLYRNFRPRRHLEFGTWQGAGVVYCLEESDATVWTLNMPFGEVVDGKNQYTSGDSFDLQASMTDEWAERIGMDKRHTHRTDSFGFIGRFYLEKGLGHRVAQMYCDSTQWDDRAYPDGFFDSALIDGGHTTDVVVSDTRKALRLVRPGGLLMWHDFCPPLRQTYSVVEGVMSGLEQCSELLSDAMEQMFWVEPSWILVGIKK